MTSGRKRGDHEAKRDEIAEAACKAILKRGLGAAGLADIAREMGYTTGVLRHYFPDKEELLLYAKNRLFDLAYDRVVQIRDQHQGSERLKVMAIELLPRDADGIDKWRLLITFNGRAIGHPELMKRQHRRNERFWALFADEIMVLQRAGELSPELDPRLEACGIIAFVDGLAEQVVMEPKEWSAEELTAMMRRYVDSIPSAARGPRRASSKAPKPQRSARQR